VAAPSILALLLLLAALVTVSLWREVSVLEARVRLAGAIPIDGPEIGTLAPSSVRNRDGVYLFLSDDCVACHEVAADLGRLRGDEGFSTLAIRVHDDHSPDAQILASLPSEVLRLPEETGDRIVSDLAIRATPLAIAVRGGLIAAKGYLRGAEDLREIGRPLLVGEERRR
jgi:hypothetical protein